MHTRTWTLDSIAAGGGLDADLQAIQICSDVRRRWHRRLIWGLRGRVWQPALLCCCPIPRLRTANSCGSLRPRCRVCTPRSADR